MEFIKSIQIKNFKSIRHEEIEGCKRINVFIGYPNTGKSNILEALSLYSLDHLSNFLSFIRIENNTTLFFNGGIDQPVSVEINKVHKYHASYLNDRLSFIYQIDLNEQQVSTYFKDSERSWVRKFDYFDDRINNFSINAPTQPFALAQTRKYEYKKQIEYTEGEFDNLRQPFGTNIFEVISVNESIRKEIAEIFKFYDLKFSFDKGTRTFKILKDVGDDIFLIPYSMIADTLQRIIFFKAAISSNKNRILLFEEPEAHVFPPFIKKFTSDLIFDKSNQFFLATHSPYILDALLEDAQEDLAVYLVHYVQGETKVKLMEQKDIEEVREYGVDIFFNLESYLEHGQIGNV